MRNLIAVSAVAACVALAGCGGDDEPISDSGPPTNADAAVRTEAQADVPEQEIQEAGRTYDGQRGQVEDVLRQSYAALAQGDGDAVCALQSKQLKARFVKIERMTRAKFRGKSCGEIRSMLADLYTPEARESFYRIKVKRITIKGKRATVIHEVPDTDPTHKKVDTNVPLRLQDGSWKLDG